MRSTLHASPLFDLGRPVATPGALEFCREHRINPLALLARHHRGDWGDLDEADRAANESALQDGSRLFSSYRVGTAKLWVITEADRSATTLLLPDEY